MSSLTENPAPSGRAAFRTTHWSIVLSAGNQSPEALEQLCRTYWYPLYAYARRRGERPEDAQDLTQQFFAAFLEQKSFGLADPDRGRFRCFLLGSFKHFLINEYKRGRTAKRGGRYQFVSWDEAQAEGHYQNEPNCQQGPDNLFDRTWALTVLEKAMRDLQEEYAAQGKRQIFLALEPFLSDQRSGPTYAEIGKELHMSEAAVKMAVSRLRRRYGDLLLRAVADTVATAGDIEDEVRYLMRAANL